MGNRKAGQMAQNFYGQLVFSDVSSRGGRLGEGGDESRVLTQA